MKVPAGARRSSLLTLVAFGALLACGSQSAWANHIAFAKGDLVVSVGDGKVNHYSPTGTFRETLNTGTGTTDPPGNETGMCFDPQGRLYTTDFDGTKMSRFNNLGGLINPAFFVPPQGYPPESCVVEQAGQHLYTGLNESDNEILKLDTNGTMVDDFFVATDQFGISYIDLGADGCTMYYTSEGNFVLRFNVCTGTQLVDFASTLPGPCYGIRIRSNGEALVACDTQIVRLNSSGSVIQSYSPGGEADYFALALDPDGTSFWASGYSSGHVWKVNIATGAISTTFTAPLTVVNTGSAGIAVYGDAATPDPGFARPKGASPYRASLVPAYKQCTSPNRMHGPPAPLNKPSCAPPMLTSNTLTVGTSESNGVQSNSNGSVLLTTLVGNSSTPADEADVRIAPAITDVRNKNLTDYGGELQLSMTLRSTDRFNSQDPATQPFNDTGTGQDTTFKMTVPCATTTATNFGSTCSVTTTADAVIPNMIKESQRTIFGMDNIQVFDGGADGLVSTTPNTLFEDQGIFVP